MVEWKRLYPGNIHFVLINLVMLLEIIGNIFSSGYDYEIIYTFFYSASLL